MSERKWHKVERFYAQTGIAEFDEDTCVSSADYDALSKTADALYKALEGLLKNPNLYPCEHDSTHRGGAIWTICDDCGAEFADDRGGMPKFVEHPSIVKARAALDLARGENL